LIDREYLERDRNDRREIHNSRVAFVSCVNCVLFSTVSSWRGKKQCTTKHNPRNDKNENYELLSMNFRVRRLVLQWSKEDSSKTSRIEYCCGLHIRQLLLCFQ
ncbi:unnamed protein product, partial [Ectocarpus sp. 12 AP-2014]